jgi:hypothetical protein
VGCSGSSLGDKVGGRDAWLRQRLGVRGKLDEQESLTGLCTVRGRDCLAHILPICGTRRKGFRTGMDVEDNGFSV